MTVNEIRKKFIKFFEEKGHTQIPSSSLIPKDDPSVLLTTAGMQQFKDWFSGQVEPEYDRVVTIQKCVRTGDINEVGDNTHLTFFEMLGNFSFGDYWKQEAIEYAWEFLTSKEWLGIDKKRVHATYFDQSKAKKGISVIFDTDNESLKILKSIDGLEKIVAQGEDNFWSLGAVGSPGGPTVEFYVDDIEVWNLVFNEAIWKGDHWHWGGVTRGVDTGMGLERLAAVMNKVESVYETDELASLLQVVSPQLGLKKEGEAIEKAPIIPVGETERILLDHMRSAAFLLADGVRPSNLDKGYVLRKLTRRSIVKYRDLPGGNEQNICSQIAEVVIDIYKSSYPELEREKKHILDELNLEESKFEKTIENGLKKLEKRIPGGLGQDALGKSGTKLKEREITGKLAFDLFATDGFPYELTMEISKERGYKLAKNIQSEFEAEFKKHQEVSRKGAGKKFAGGLENKNDPKIVQYHTVAHLLLAAQREVLGDHVHQKGANITAERLRFDFSHPEKMTDEEREKVEDWVNDKLSQNLEVNLGETNPKTAKEKGAEGEFSSKYGDKVKVYTIGGDLDSTDFISKEICGGPHVSNLSEIEGKFRIKKEQSSSAGVRRIKAVLE